MYKKILSLGFAFWFLVTGFWLLVPYSYAQTKSVVKIEDTTTAADTASLHVKKTNVAATGPLAVFEGSGNVGIGTTAPIYDLHVKKTGSDGHLAVGRSGTIHLEDSGFTTDSEICNDATASSNIKFRVHTGGATIDAMTIGTTGNVGIGTTAPSQKLEVSGNAKITGNTLFVADNTFYLDRTNSDLPLIGFDPNDYFSFIRSTNAYSWVSGGTERMRIDGAGNVGIGTTAPTASLEVKGTMKVLGAWESKVFNTNYPAATDGFVVVNYQGTSKWGTIEGITDSNNPPTTVRCSASQDYKRTGANYDSMTMPVRKGDYWRIAPRPGYNANGIVTIYWIPLGT